MISKSEFLNRVHGSVFPLLRKVEQERVTMIKKWGIGMFIVAVILTIIACYGLGFEKMTQKDSYWILVPVATFIIPLLIGGNKLDVFSYQLKQKFIPTLYDLVELKKKEEEQKIPDKKGDVEEEAEEEAIEQVSGFRELLNKGLFPSNSYLGGYDDDFSAKDYSFGIKEMKASIGHGKGERTVFEGFVFESNLDIKIGGEILVLQKLNFMSAKKFKPKKSLGYQKFSANDAVFDNHFQVYAKNEIDVKSRLNKIFLRQIMSLHDIYPKAIINLLIESGKIIISVNTNKNMFEFFKIYRSLLKDKFFEQFYDEIAALYKVRDAFKNG